MMVRGGSGPSAEVLEGRRLGLGEPATGEDRAGGGSEEGEEGAEEEEEEREGRRRRGRCGGRGWRARGLWRGVERRGV